MANEVPRGDVGDLLQALDFAYAYFAASTNRRPREVFHRLARARGISDEAFDAWAKDKTWEGP